jgi:hypothetical protein
MDMSEETMELARRGFEAWQAGEFKAVESLMDPNVRWRAHDPELEGCGLWKPLRLAADVHRVAVLTIR